MKNIGCLQRVQMVYPQFTKAEKRVADYVMQNPKSVVYMSINDLAAAAGVGYTSVFRFCKTLKMDGYQDFKTSLSLSISEEIAEPDVLSSVITAEDSFSVVSQKLLNETVTAITDSFNLLNEETVKKMVEFLVRAPHIYFYGVGSSMPIAMAGMARFLKIFPRVYCFQDSYLQAMSSTMLRPDDVAMIITYTGASKDTVHVAKLASEAGAHVFTITRFEKSPVIAYSEFTLLCGGNERAYQSGPTSAHLSQLYLLDLLYLECYRRRYEISGQISRRMSDAVADKSY